MKKSLFSFLLLFSTILFSNNNNVDIVIYSYHRPMQLYALLESIHSYMQGYNDIYVIYRADNQEFEDGYKIVKDDFLTTFFLKQSQNPRRDFKQLTLDVFERDSSYVLFAVDDILVKDYVDLQECQRVLKKTESYGFFLRLGTNLSYCYATSSNQAIPLLNYIDATICSWDIKTGQHDWGYPFNLDMTLYPKAAIKKIVTDVYYYTPNSFEGSGRGFAYRSGVYEKKGLCFHTSKIVNIPLNIVQSDYPRNNQLNRYSVEYLLNMFRNGFKIDITSVEGIHNSSAHDDIPLKFIPFKIVR